MTDRVNQKESIGFKTDSQQTRVQLNPQDDSERRLRQKVCSRPRINMSEAFRKDFKHIKLRIYIDCLSGNTLGLKNIQMKSCPKIIYSCH